jgi:alanine racemase
LTTTQSIDQRLAAAGLPPLPRRVWAEIDEDALVNNVNVFRELLQPGVELMAVVKADAYGHGLVPVARALESAGVRTLCVASLDEGMALREAGIDTSILVLFDIPADGLAAAARHAITISVTSDGPLLAALEQPWDSADDLVNVTVEVETGLSRGGLKPDALAEVLHRVRRSGRALGPLDVWTHIASPDNADATDAQVAAYERAIASAESVGEFTGIGRHMAATGGLLTGRVPQYEGVRIGLGLYGLLPDELPIPDHLRPAAERLRPVMAIKCQALRVETFPAGTAVSYGGRWVAQRESRIATLPIGYGDGFVRAYTPGAEALVRGHRVPLVGVVAMDAVMADVTDVGDVGPEDEFVLLGSQGQSEVVTNELARLRTTIPWEIVTSMAHRLPRVYHAGPVLKGLRTLSGEARVGSTTG